MRKLQECREGEVTYVVLIHLPLGGWFPHLRERIGWLCMGPLAGRKGRLRDEKLEELLGFNYQGDVQHVVA